MARVLVVEDDEVVRGVVAEHLRRSGHLVFDAASAADALKAVEPLARRPDVAVLDIGLPDMDGFALVAALRGLPQLSGLPVVFLSGRMSDEDIQAGRALGCPYLTKPFIASALLSVIDREASATSRMSSDLHRS